MHVVGSQSLSFFWIGKTKKERTRQKGWRGARRDTRREGQKFGDKGDRTLDFQQIDDVQSMQS